MNILSFFFKGPLLLLLLFGGVSAYAQMIKVSIEAPSAILINPDTGAILYEKNAHTPRYPASIVKIATVLFALEHKKVDLDQKVTVSQEAVASILASTKQAAFDKFPSHRIEHDGTVAGLKKGEVVTVNTLLHGMMLSSANDAANALAEFCSGSYVQFEQELNAYLKTLGLTQTYFTNPHGLHHPEMRTTAYEMAKMTTLAMKNPVFRQIVCKASFDAPPSNVNEEGKRYVQLNRLLRKGPSYYPKAVGVKTGYHANAGFNLVSAAEDNGRLLIAVVLGCVRKDQRFKESIALFEAAFKEKKVIRTLLAKESDDFSLALKGGSRPLKARLQEDLTIEYYPAEEPKVSAQIHWKELKLPIHNEQIVGCVKITNEKGKIMAARPLYATHEIKGKFFYRLMSKKHLFLPPLFGGLLGVMVVLLRRLRKDKQLNS